MFNNLNFFALVVILLAFTILFDITIIEWIVAIRSNIAIDIFNLITDLGDGTEFFCIAGFLIFLGWINNGKSIGAYPLNSELILNYGILCLKVLIITGGIILSIKFGVGRSRPDLWIESGIFEFLPFNLSSTHEYKSFPSGHTQTAFTVAVLLSLLLPKRLHPILYSLAALVGISRVVLLAHWPSDILIGALIGVFVPLIIIKRSSLYPLNERRLL